MKRGGGGGGDFGFEAAMSAISVGGTCCRSNERPAAWLSLSYSVSAKRRKKKQQPGVKETRSPTDHQRGHKVKNNKGNGQCVDGVRSEVNLRASLGKGADESSSRTELKLKQQTRPRAACVIDPGLTIHCAAGDCCCWRILANVVVVVVVGRRKYHATL
ncbi:unnamed protein product [Soboliphyme baturini]|uniref:Uncharacterized protein n=1 Tax=Soboliphyme baturini TaxID=241478 RepID=A0A183IQ49_9BILA|nr:unnamed protein product [Soboliphyme baturini]